MSSFGEKLKREREAGNKTIEEIALATGIQLGYLEALEKDEFHALPGRAFGKLYIRAYAEVLGFNPQSLIDDYDREQSREQQASTASPRVGPTPPRPVEAAIARWRETRTPERKEPIDGGASIDLPRPEPVEAAPDENVQIEPAVLSAPRPADADAPPPETIALNPQTASRPNRSIVLVLVFFGLVVGAAGIYLTFFRRGVAESVPQVSALPAPESPSQDAPPVRAAVPSASPTAVQPVAVAPKSHGILTVSEFGVGRRIVNRRLEGEDDRFADGDVVWFSTRVLGGRPDDSIRHVWLHEGRAVQSIPLGLGGPDWHTHSSKRIRGVGQWTVEARDPEGRVLARATFTCVAARR